MTLALAQPVVEVAQAPSLRWEALQSEHVVVHYAVGEGGKGHSDRVAAERVLAEAESLWLPLCAEVDYFPVERAHVLLLPEDGANGWTWPAWDWIILSDHPGGLLERLRGPMDPVRYILRHELGHFLTLKKARRTAEPVESVDLNVSLRDGRHNVALEAGLGISTLTPHWWSEGSAEAAGVFAGLGSVSAEQRQTLLAAAREHRLLGGAWDSRGAKDNWGDTERSYQQGLAFFLWLEESQGLGLAEVTAEMRRRGGVRPALRALTGQSLSALRETFLESLGGGHTPPSAPDTGAWELWPVPLGERLAYHSGGYLLVEERDPRSIQGLGGEAEWGPRLAVPIAYGSRPAVVGETAVVVGKDRLRRGLDLSVLDREALFVVDLSGAWEAESWRVRRRATELPGTVGGTEPAISEDGKQLAWVHVRDGGGYLMRGPLRGPYQEVAGGPGEWWRTPIFLSDGRIVAVHRVGDRADIAVVSAEGVGYLTASEASEADLGRTPDDRVLFTADMGDAREVFALDPDTGAVAQLTDLGVAVHTPAMSRAGDLLYARASASGVRLEGIAAESLAPVDATESFAGGPVVSAPTPMVASRTARPHAFTPLALTPFLALGMSAADDLDLAGGLSFATRTYTDIADVHGAFWLGEEPGASLSLRRRLGPLHLELSGGALGWERPVRTGQIEGWRMWGSTQLALQRQDTRAAVGVRTAEIGIRDGGRRSLVAGIAELRVSDARRVDLAVEGYEIAAGVEAGWEEAPYAQAWAHIDAESRVPSSLGAAWRQHHAFLAGLDILASTPVHPWLAPRAGGLGNEALLGRSLLFPGYPELAVTSDALLVTRLGYRLPLVRWRRLVGPYFAEGATFEVDGHLGVAGDRLPADVGGRLALRGTVRDARWDVAVRVAMPLVALPVGDLDGDDVFDALRVPPPLREEPARPRVLIEVGRIR